MDLIFFALFLCRYEILVTLDPMITSHSLSAESFLCLLSLFPL